MHIVLVMLAGAVQSFHTNLRQNARSRRRVSNVACSLSSQSSTFTSACSYTVGNSSCSFISVGCYGTVKLENINILIVMSYLQFVVALVGQFV